MIKNRSIEEYVERITNYVFKSVRDVLHEPATNIPYPFLVPGAQYNHQLWDWDSFFTTIALLQILDKQEKLGILSLDIKEKYLNHARGNVLNFLYAQMEDGYIPIAMAGGYDYFNNTLHRNGCLTNMHKPCLAMNAALISGYTEDFNWLSPHYDKLLKYFECYEMYYKDEKSGLFVWANDVMIGFDNEPATFGRPPMSSGNIFLNSMMVREMKNMACISKNLGDKKNYLLFMDKANMLHKAIDEECWDKRDGFYYSVDVNCKTHIPNQRVAGFHTGLGVTWKTIPLKVQSCSSFTPLWAGIASMEQAIKLVTTHAMNENTFYSHYGIRSLSKEEKMYSMEATSNPSNWLGPIWLVTNYMIFRGLMKYGFTSQAHELGERLLLLLGNDIEENNCFHEYYVPETGRGVMNKGFLSWNLLIFNIISELEGQGSIERYMEY